MNEVWKVAKGRFRELMKDQSGVALMLTLSVFMLLYIACAGIYAIAETVREKIEMQNISDSMAYSAAVVQADGLSRMAMINRAMSWTYVQLTNLQLDYITYRWMEKTRNRFREDRQKCKTFNDESVFLHIEVPWCNCESLYKGSGRGWFCGVAPSQSDKIRMNGHLRDFSTLDQQVNSLSSIAQYSDAISRLKKTIETYNTFLAVVNIEMFDSIYATASAVLLANLPRKSVEGGEYDIDRNAAKDMSWILQMRAASNPYASFEGESEEASGGYFSPLFNTELGERIFLTMADGAVYDTLEPYFSNGDSQKMSSGGLDQWFIRSDPAESATNANHVQNTAWSYKAPGICRVYKNANRVEAGDPLRAHHTTVSPALDNTPSCVNTRRAFPEQCVSVAETTALYSEYDWAAIQMICSCFLEYRKYDIIEHHIQVGLPLDDCGHVSCSGGPKGCPGHARSAYDTCYREIGNYKATQLVLPRVEKVPLSPTGRHPDVKVDLLLTQKPYGHARIYGDDPDIYDAATYTGAVAKPWILNDTFYSGAGSLIVGLARRQRNPFSQLLHVLEDVLPVNEEGLHSAFNPTEKGQIVVFSAARAAHRPQPSAQQRQAAIATGYELETVGPREYETRYDAVCHDDEEVPNFNLNISEGALKQVRVGCVCNDKDNKARFARCWNLCTTDWDATLLPLPYSVADCKFGWYDSYLHDQKKLSTVTWENIETSISKNKNPILEAAGSPWSPITDEDGNLITDAQGAASGDGTFLQLMTPSGMDRSKYSVLDVQNVLKVRVL